MDEITLVKGSYLLIRKDLGLEDEICFEDNEKGFDWLEAYLTHQINDLLDHDFNRLLNALYRIDLPEAKVNELLHGSSPDECARNIARAVIAREKQKVVTREQYRSL